MKQYVVKIIVCIQGKYMRIASYTFKSQWRAVDFIEEIRAGIFRQSEVITELRVEEIEDAEESEVTND